MSGRQLSRFLACVLAFAVAGAGTAAAAAPTDISKEALDTNAAPTTPAALAAVRPVTAPHAMVVTAQHLATEAGVSILRAGGNAVDAAVAIGYALAVVDPCCGNIGGGGFMLLHLASGSNVFLDFREKAPLRASANMYLDAAGNVVPGASTHTYLGVGVPGTVMGLNAALRKYGTMTLSRVMAPAIGLARDGYVLTAGDVNLFNRRADEFRRHPNVAAIYLKNGEPYSVGDRLRQPELARTLELIDKDGDDAFYRGPIARKVVAASVAEGGILSMRDFADYSVEWDDPVRCGYRGYTIVSDPPPSSGGTTICQILGILEPYPLAEWGYGATKSLHYVIEAERRAFADRNTYLGDPAFVHNAVDALLAPAHLADMRATIDADKATPSSEIKGSLNSTEGTNTTSYAVVDRLGNAVAVTYTINFLFGIGQIAGDTGFFLNNEMDDFTSKIGVPNSFGLVQGRINLIEPGKRPLSSMAPTIVVRGGKLFMVTGSPGGSTIITTTLQSILNVVDFGMNMQQSVDAPRFHHQWYPDLVLVEPGILTDPVHRQLEAMGYQFKVIDSWGADEAILFNPRTHLLEGANDRRRPAGSAAGY